MLTTSFHKEELCTKKGAKLSPLRTRNPRITNSGNLRGMCQIWTMSKAILRRFRGHYCSGFCPFIVSELHLFLAFSNSGIRKLPLQQLPHLLLPKITNRGKFLQMYASVILAWHSINGASVIFTAFQGKILQQFRVFHIGILGHGFDLLGTFEAGLLMSKGWEVLLNSKG